MQRTQTDEAKTGGGKPRPYAGRSQTGGDRPRPYGGRSG